jgi:hypothetical protein
MVNMSVWETLAALRDFAYRNGPHLDYMRGRREWFHRMPEQHLVLWWVPAGHIPSLSEALSRLELLRRNGPSPLAFTFREPYDPPAEPVPLEYSVGGLTCGFQRRSWRSAWDHHG